MTSVRRRCGGMGFTLVELLVVVIIMAVLVAVLLPTISRVRRAALKSKLDSTVIQSLTGDGANVATARAEPIGRPAARVHTFAADVTLTPRLSVGTAEPESIYETKFAAKLNASRADGAGDESEIRLPLPPQIISVADLSVTVDGTQSESIALDGDDLVWHGPLPANAPASMNVEYTAVGLGLYSLETPPSKILDRFQINLTANGSDVRILQLSMQPTGLARQSNATTYTWDYKRLMFGRPIVLDVLGIAPIDRLGQLSWLGPLAVVVYGLVLGLVSRAFDVQRIDKWMLLLIIGTFTAAFPLMYFAQEFMGLNAAMLASASAVLIIIAARTLSIMGFRIGLLGAVVPAAAIMTITLLAATRPQLQGILLTVLALGMFLLAMMLAPRLGLNRLPTLQKIPPAQPTPTVA